MNSGGILSLSGGMARLSGYRRKKSSCRKFERIKKLADNRPQYSLGEETGLVGEASAMKRKTNFDRYFEEQLKDAVFAERFKKAGEAWDVALELAALKKESGLSQKELAKRVGTTQQQISRLESPSYEGHSLSMLRRVAEALGATIHIELLRGKQKKSMGIAEGDPPYGSK